jgi:hypothetical protein
LGLSGESSLDAFARKSSSRWNESGGSAKRKRPARQPRWRSQSACARKHELATEDAKMFVPMTLDQALARGEVLAADTTESTHVIRVGDWVYKFLQPLRRGSWRSLDDYIRQLPFDRA